MKTGYSFGSLVSFVEALNAAAVKITGDQTIAGLKTFSSNPITSAAQGSGGGYLTRKDYVDGALALKAPLASPALTGVPTAPTAAAGTNTTQLATTAFVTSANTAQLASAAPLMDGTAAVGISTLLARQDHIHPTDTSRAPLVSPALTGTPTAPTAAAGTNTTQIATTAFVTASNTAQLGAATPLMDGTAAVGTSTLLSRQDHIHPTDASRAPLASPALTGTPTAPTAATGTDTTQIATTAFCLATHNAGLASAAPLMDGVAAIGSSTLAARQDHIHPTDTTRAPLASPSFTGDVRTDTRFLAKGDIIINATIYGKSSFSVMDTQATTNTHAGLVVYLGKSTDTKAAMLILCPKYATTLLNKAGCSGVVRKSRGRADSSLYESFVNFTCVSAYNASIAEIFAQNMGARIVTTTYNSGTYYALWFPAGSSADYTFEGTRYNKDFSPVFIPDATAYTVADVVTGESYARLASPNFTGAPTAPTAADGTSNTQLATTAFVSGAIAAARSSAAPLMDGTASIGTSTLLARQDHVHPADTSKLGLGTAAPLMDGTATVGTSTLGARQDHVHPTDTSRAPLTSPALTGTPTAPTAAAGTNTTQIATTAFVTSANTAQVGTATPLMDGTAAVGTSTLLSRQDHVHPTDTSRAPLASPALTGVPTAPTAAIGTNDTRLATTAFVQRAIGCYVTHAAVVATASTIDISYIGRLTTAGAEGITFTIPVDTALAGVLVGSAFAIRTSSNYSATIVPASTVSLYDEAGASVTSYTIPVNSSIEVTHISGTNAWVISSFSGVATTPATGDNSTRVATTAFVAATKTAMLATDAPLMDGTASVGASTLLARQDHRHPTDTSRAPLASPALTGTPTAPTAAAGTNTTQVATTAFVQSTATSIVTNKASSATPLMNGAATAGTSTNYTREDHIHPTDTSRAPLASPAFTGTPTAPTPAAGTKNTQLATTAFVTASNTAQIGTDTPLMSGIAAAGTSTLLSRQDHVHPTDTSRAPLASPAFTGSPTAPTPASTSNGTAIATTEFVKNVATPIMPVGAVIYFAASTPPTGFLVCNGSAISRTTYYNLYLIVGTTYGAGDGSTTFNLPDLRGEFIRGWDNGRGIDAGRGFGTSQSDAFQGHKHLPSSPVGFTGGWGDQNSNIGKSLTETAGTVDGGYGTPRISTETRPRNVALLPCIKY